MPPLLLFHFQWFAFRQTCKSYQTKALQNGESGDCQSQQEWLNRTIKKITESRMAYCKVLVSKSQAERANQMQKLRDMIRSNQLLSRSRPKFESCCLRDGLLTEADSTCATRRVFTSWVTILKDDWYYAAALDRVPRALYICETHFWQIAYPLLYLYLFVCFSACLDNFRLVHVLFVCVRASVRLYVCIIN